ncbi:MAG: hypothetical protein IJE48_05310 [Clostridia bacterium]|nr:hypothetical protein [Clostridia bacterium]
MTSKKSSVNPFRFTFLRTCSRNWLVPLGVFLLTGYAFFVCGFVDAKRNYNRNLTDGSVAYYLANHKFQLSDNNWGGLGFVIDLLLIAASVVLAISIFRYMFSKKSVNVYYSLGMKRGEMFLSKYLAGAFLLTVSVVIPMLADVIGNITIFGSSKELWISAIYMTVCVVQMMLYAYSVTVLVCCCVGTILEAGFFGLVFIASPIIAEYLVSVLFKTVLYGSPYGGGFDYSTMIYGQGHYRPPVSFTALQNNILFFASGRFSKYHELQRGIEEVPYNFKNPQLLPVLVMLAVIVAVAFASYVFYKKRKNEIAGFLGSNPVITGIGIFTISAFLFAFISRHIVYLDHSNRYLAFLLAFGMIFVVYTVIQIISLRSIKLFFKKFRFITVHFALMAALIAVFVTGLFGYSTRIPDKSEIEKIAVSTGTGDIFYNNASSYSTVHSFVDSYYQGITVDAGVKAEQNTLYLIDGYDSPEEVEHILDIHRRLIEMKDDDFSPEARRKSFGERKVLSATRIIYTLKDGSTFDRLYTCSDDETNRLLSQLTRTENYKKGAAEELSWYFGFKEVTFENDEYSEYGYLLGDYEISVPADEILVSIASPNYSSLKTAPSLNTKESFRELYDALASDILSGRLPLDFNTDSPVKGYIQLSSYNESYFDKPKEMTESWHTNNVIISIGDANIVIPVYESMTDTLAVIEKHGCTSLFENAKEPVAVETWKYGEKALDPYGSIKTTLIQGVYLNNEGKIDEFSTYYSSFDENGEKLNMVAPKLAPDAVETDNPIQIKKYSDAFRMMTLDCFDGYYVRLIFEDGSCVYGYAPMTLVE